MTIARRMDFPTERELNILELLAEGVRPADIAKSLYVSERTVKNDLYSMKQRWGCTNPAHLVGHAYRHKFL